MMVEITYRDQRELWSRARQQAVARQLGQPLAAFPSTLRQRGVLRLRLRTSLGLWEDTPLTQGARNSCPDLAVGDSQVIGD